MARCIIVEPNTTGEDNAEVRERFHPLGLSLLFGLFYFIQGVSEPTEGLIAQPVRSLLKEWGQNAEQISTFAALLSLPWAIKPLYGLISDFIPLAGYHRKSYLIVASAVTSASLGILYWRDLPPGSVDTLFVLLLLPTLGVAFSDVVIDALMVEKGQPRGLTGRLQAVQWGAIWAATILTGSLGGYLSQHSQQRLGFLICGGMMLGTLVLSLLVVSEQRVGYRTAHFHSTLAILRQAAASRTILSAGLFLFLWNFNPFSTTVLYLYSTRSLDYSEQFYGNLTSLGAVGAMTGSLVYGLYCHRVPMRALIHLSIALGVFSNFAYWLMRSETSAAVIFTVTGFTTATAIMVQLDLAAQVCPPRTAGTLFALMMSLSNLGTSLSTWFGGWFYEAWLPWGNPLAFNLLVGVGALFTAGCWLVVPLLRRGPPRTFPANNST